MRDSVRYFVSWSRPLMFFEPDEGSGLRRRYGPEFRVRQYCALSRCRALFTGDGPICPAHFRRGEELLWTDSNRFDRWKFDAQRGLEKFLGRWPDATFEIER